MSRQYVTWTIYALLTLGLSFSLSYQFFDWQQQARFWKTVASKKDLKEQIGYLAVSGRDEFAAAAFDAGFSGSQVLSGTIDVLQRLPDGRLRVAGWAIDRQEPDKPVSVFIIAKKKIVFVVDTYASRDDVARVLRFPNDFMKPGFDYTFNHQVSCEFAEELFVVAFNAQKQFAFISRAPKLQGC